MACAMFVPAVENASSESGPWKLFMHPSSRYSVSYPRDWRVATGPKGDFTIFNFPRERSIHGVVLPEHGAEIDISAQEFAEDAVDEWIRKDLLDERPDYRKTINIPNAKCDGPQSFVEVSWKWEAGPGAYFREVAGYFVVHNRAFRAQLTFWEGDAEESQYRSILRHMISSLSVSRRKE